jgi:lysozyme family protein
MRIIKASDRYKAVSRAMEAPWFVVGVIHMMEASLNFSKHLHNGDPLSARTVRVPAGRPSFGEPPFTWEESAIDAFEMKRLGAIGNWTIEQFAYRMEAYNGFGYRTKAKPPIPSPYLWSYSNQYTKGKFVKDGVYDADAVSRQIGAMPLLRELAVQAGLVLTRESASPSRGKRRGKASAYTGHAVKSNTRDTTAVKKVQTALNQSGVGPVAVSGEFDAATESAVRLFQARYPDFSGEALSVDGVVGPLTWSALFAIEPDASETNAAPDTDLLRAVIEIASAESDAGVREIPPRSNSGERVETYWRSAGFTHPVPWCVCFLFWCFSEAAAQIGADNPFPKTGGVHRLWSLARNTGMRTVTAEAARADPALVRPGMIFFIDAGRDTEGNPIGHAGIVAASVGADIITIEGNTDDRGGRTGGRVMVRRRTIRKINMGFILIDS